MSRKSENDKKKNVLKFNLKKMYGANANGKFKSTSLIFFLFKTQQIFFLRTVICKVITKML